MIFAMRSFMAKPYPIIFLGIASFFFFFMGNLLAQKVNKV